MNEEAVDFSEPDPDRMYKTCTRDDTTYSLSLLHGRIYLYKWSGNDSASVEFKGDTEVFLKFPQDNPEEWFSIAAELIANRR